MTLPPLPELVREIENCITARHLDAALALCSNLRAAIAAVPANAEEWLRGRFGAARGHAEWRMLTEAFNAGKATAAPDAAVPAQPVAWLGGDGHPHHISAMQTITERRIHGPWQPLYAAPQAVPAGWVLVPVDPTEAMLKAGLDECEPLGSLIDWDEGFGRDEMRDTYRAMLAAAPKEQPHE